MSGENGRSASEVHNSDCNEDGCLTSGMCNFDCNESVIHHLVCVMLVVIKMEILLLLLF